MATGSNKFPVKLYDILQEAENAPNLAEIISWMPDGKSFKVHKKDEFSRVILPTVFGTNVYKSYQRNLHFWGFQNIRKGTAKGVCSHRYFLRGHPELLKHMRRVRAPTKNGIAPYHPDANSEHMAAVEAAVVAAAAATAGTGTATGAKSSPLASSSNQDRTSVPTFIFANNNNRGDVKKNLMLAPHRAVSPSSEASRAVMHSPRKNKNNNDNNNRTQEGTSYSDNQNDTAALLMMLRQQNEQQQHQQQQQQRQQQTPSAVNALSSTQGLELLLAQHLLAQQEQQQQQQLQLQSLLAASLGQSQQSHAQTQASATEQQNALTQALLLQLLQKPGGLNMAPSLNGSSTSAQLQQQQQQHLKNNNNNNSNAMTNLLAGLLR